MILIACTSLLGELAWRQNCAMCETSWVMQVALAALGAGQHVGEFENFLQNK